MMWNDLQIKKHWDAAQLLDSIKDKVFHYIGTNVNISEKGVQQFIIKNFEENNIQSDKDPPIVAFSENTSHVHYFPSENSKILEKESLILIDIWAHFKDPGAPFADITWMGYYGKKIPDKIQVVFDIIIRARDAAINFIREEIKNGKIPLGKEIDAKTRDIIKKNGFDGKFLHGTGHSLGFTSPHGNKSKLNSHGRKPLLLNQGYTIEPGIYLENELGIRSEIDFYINEKKELIITTPIQNKIVMIT